MKKKYIAIICIIILIIIAVSAFFLIKNNIDSKKTYEIAKIEEYNYFVLRQDDKYGVIDRQGNILINPTYAEVKIPNPEKAVFVCKEENDNIKILNNNNEELMTEYEQIEPIKLKNIQSDLMYEKSVLKYKKDNKYGLINFEGKEITKPEYDEIDSLGYKEGELLVKKDNKYGIMNINGYLMIPTEYDQISVDKYYTDENSYKDAGYIVSITTNEGYRYGYINKDGKKLLETEYNELSRINEIENSQDVYILCAKNGQYGINKNEENIIPNEYQSITYNEANNIFIVERSKKYGVRNINGKEIIPVEYSQIDTTGIYIYAQNQEENKVFNSLGEEQNISSNIEILNTDNENYRIKIDSTNGTKYGVVNKNNEQIIEEKYNYIKYLSDNYFIASAENGKLGIIDDKDSPKLELKYDAIEKIYNKDIIQANITSENITELYSKDLQQLCSIQNAIVESNKDYIKIYNDTETKYFNNDGQELQNTDIFPNNNLYSKIENGKWGFVDKMGNVKVDYQYDRVTEFNEYGFAAVQKDGKWGAINQNGEVVIEPTYELNSSETPSFIGKYYKVTYGVGEIYYTDKV